jgi:hypothetical protein
MTARALGGALALGIVVACGVPASSLAAPPAPAAKEAAGMTVSAKSAGVVRLNHLADGEAGTVWIKVTVKGAKGPLAWKSVTTDPRSQVPSRAVHSSSSKGARQLRVGATTRLAVGTTKEFALAGSRVVSLVVRDTATGQKVKTAVTVVVRDALSKAPEVGGVYCEACGQVGSASPVYTLTPGGYSATITESVW